MEVLEIPLLLASGSPRRSQLLKEAGFQFRVQPSDAPEDFPANYPVEQVPELLARRKARAVQNLSRVREVIVAADSVVIVEGQILNKPADREEALEMLEKLSGQVHRVVTGVCLKKGSREVSFSGKSDVTVAPLETDEMAYYVDQFAPYDKAGGYGIQEWLGLCRVTHIAGTYANIMGLPVDQVYEQLKTFLKNGS